MRNPDLHTGAAQIRKGLDLLQETWEEAADQWNDVVSARFREQHLEPRVPEIKLSLDAISRMQLLLNEVQRDLEQ